MFNKLRGSDKKKRNNLQKVVVDIPAHVQDYLQKNAGRLLEADEEYVHDLFKQLMDFPEDYQLQELEVAALHAILTHFEGAEKIEKPGIRGVIEGGISKLPKSIRNRLPNKEIKGVISDITFYSDHEDTNISFLDKDGKEIVFKGLSRFNLDGENLFIGYAPSFDAVGYFTVEFNGEKVKLKPVTDDARYKLIEEVWKVLEKKRKEVIENDEVRG